MPARAAWFHRLPDIAAVVSSSETAFFDRAAVETLFQIKPRRAQQLLRELATLAGDPSPAQIGQGFVLRRESFLAALGALADSEEMAREIRNQIRTAQRITEAQAEASARQIRIPVSTSPERHLGSLPPGIVLQP